MKSSEKNYQILILSDESSWIKSYLNELSSDWEVEGHSIRIQHTIENTQPGDFCFCLSFSQIVSQEIRKKFKNTLVVHESDLPQGKGWAPMTWQILEGKNRIPVSLIEAVDAVDAGAIYLQEWIELTGIELNPEWRHLQAHATMQLCKKWVQMYPQVIQQARAQTGVSTYHPKRTPKDSRIDPHQTLSKQFNLLRVVDNDDYPAFFELNGQCYRLKIDRFTPP